MSTAIFRSDKHKNPTQHNYHVMTFEECKNIKSSRVHLLDRYGRIIEVKINGAIKLWKTRPFDLKIPVKYGLYEYSYIEFSNGQSIGEIAIMLDD